MSNGIRVLLIDDETSFSDSLAKVLSRRGMNVESAPDGQKALLMLADKEFDVIVLDLRMPGMDGLATLRRIKESSAQTPVIFLTGYVDSSQLLEAVEDGAVEVLFKPCPVGTLVRSIENAFESKELATELAKKAVVP